MVTTSALARCRGPRGPFSPLGRATRPRPRGCFGRPRVPGRHAPWAVASGRFSAQYCARVLNVFFIVLNSRNCFKLQKFVETCKNVQNLPNKFGMNPLEPLHTVGLTKITFMLLILVQKFQELRYLNNCLQISMLANNLKICMHVYTISHSSYKKLHN
jgi:hypothetical protein